METGTCSPSPADLPARQSSPDILSSEKFILPFNTFLEYAGAALGIIGWLGVRQIGSPEAQMIGFLLWVIGGITLVAWGYYTKARGIMVINLVRRTLEGSLMMEGLLFSTNFRWGFEPGVFQPVLPKNLIHRMVPGEMIYDFMEAWKQAARLTIGIRPLGLRQWFVASARALTEMGWSIDPRRRFLQQGYLLWKRSISLD